MFNSVKKDDVIDQYSPYDEGEWRLVALAIMVYSRIVSSYCRILYIWGIGFAD